MERMPEAEWGENPREWVTVKRARRDKSDTSEPDLCSCRHRESMDVFFVRTAGGCADFFVLRRPHPPETRRCRESCTTHVLSGQRMQNPLLQAACQNRSPLRRREPPEGRFLCVGARRDSRRIKKQPDTGSGKRSLSGCRKDGYFICAMSQTISAHFSTPSVPLSRQMS